MDIFIDSADVRDLRAAAASGLVDGVTTNPSLIARSGRDMKEAIAEICSIVSGPVSAEAVASDVEGMLAEGRYLASIAENVVVKLPLTPAGLTACQRLVQDGIRVNVTLCFSSVQALLAAKAGATFISPFIGRLDDAGLDGMELIREIRTIYDNYGYTTRILAASIRTINHVRDAALLGADCATLPPKIFNALYSHILTDTGLQAFLEDWRSTGQSILK
ncbi:MAG: fructose-6-phosphate aldolase [Alphaproteobacteria bacterium]|nr:fructose-6-phosphate aldolase [Alphaproteobacteria bacterium]